ncbi:hypothetical protein MMC14_007341 [Varicellaria rhodocarpa]|nr:hypothetical protein [Varicellaria rhodocarpa]
MSSETIEDYCVRVLQDLATHIDDDPINSCGKELIKSILIDPEEVIKYANEKLHIFPFNDVQECWKRLYTDASITRAIDLILEQVQTSKEERITVSEKWLNETANVLDMALIMTGAPRREAIIHELFAWLEQYSEDRNLRNRDRKRRKLPPSTFPKSTVRHPEIIYPIPKLPTTTSEFATHLSSSNVHPIVITSALEDWHARKLGTWDSPSYLLSKTFNGRRLVPIELGTSYTSDDFGQTIIRFREYIENHLTIADGEQLSYLAQHDLFAQIPALRKDILIPKFCYVLPTLTASPNDHTENSNLISDNDIAPPKEPLIKAWLGPAGTLSPLHTDPYHNILAQVVGSKYVRLYPPSETPNLYPRGVTDEGIDMSNTSQVPVELVEMAAEIGEGYDDTMEDDEAMGEAFADEGMDEDDDTNEEPSFPQFHQARYVETILQEGECLFIPVGWWHYVRSLSTSFSVSFWWN